MAEYPVSLELLFLLLLILANGVFAMAEIAVVSSRRTRLEARADGGDAGARRALQLAEHPTRFLSTIQIGITLVGIFAGAYGGARLSGNVSGALVRVPALAPYADALALALVVAGITFLTLVVGELVPKRIALTHPERIASALARPMHALSVAVSPVVKLLTVSTDALLRLLRIRKAAEPPVTEEEVSALIRQGAEAGVFEEEERDLVEGVFALGDRSVVEIMTPRRRIVWLDVALPLEENLARMAGNRHSRFPVAENGLDNVLGVVDIRDVWTRSLAGKSIDLRTNLRPPLFVPEGLAALQLLEKFRETGVHFALVLDEYGGIEGLVTLHDVLEEVSGKVIPGAGLSAVRRPDGSWLVDASLTMGDFWDALDLEEPAAEERPYVTLGGLAVTTLGHIPSEGDCFEAFGLRFEVVDMDGHRVDKLLVKPPESPVGGD